MSFHHPNFTCRMVSYFTTKETAYSSSLQIIKFISNDRKSPLDHINSYHIKKRKKYVEVPPLLVVLKSLYFATPLMVLPGEGCVPCEWRTRYGPFTIDASFPSLIGFPIFEPSACPMDGEGRKQIDFGLVRPQDFWRHISCCLWYIWKWVQLSPHFTDLEYSS